MSHPPILIVNENDEPIGISSKKEAQEKGLIHRIAQVIVEDPSGRILLQKRAGHIELHPGLWDTSVGGHVDEGEDYLEAAKREMFEEIGLTGLKLNSLGKYRKYSMSGWRHLNRFYMIFNTIIPAASKFTIEPEEVSEVRWFTKNKINKLIKEQPDKFTNGIKEAINRYYS